MDNLVAEYPGLVSKMNIVYSFKNRPMNELKNRMWQKTQFKVSGSLSVGVDPNRNWDVGFGVEVKSIVDFTKSPGKVTAFITFHSYSQLLMFPYGYTCAESHKFDELVMAQKAAQSLTSLHSTKYKMGPVCSVI
ncbi:hypothetical protein DBR06_SOUSAS1010151, partial [Sousa chinensis]